jgi:hypothetical protein
MFPASDDDQLKGYSQVNKILSNYLIIIFVEEQRKKIISAQD